MKTPIHSTKMYRRAVLLPVIAIASSAFGATHHNEERDISVYREHYSTGGRVYADLDQLEAAVRATRPASVRIVSCEPSATRAWLATVPRFDDLPLHLLVVGPSSPACPPAAMPAAATSGAAAVDDAAVRKYWEQRMP